MASPGVIRPLTVPPPARWWGIQSSQFSASVGDACVNTSQRELADRLFAEALAFPREQQPAFLAQSSDDAEVRSEVESLLAFASRPLMGITEAVGSVAG